MTTLPIDKPTGTTAPANGFTSPDSSTAAPTAVPFPMTGQNIVCFAKDWSEDATCCNHVLHELAKHNRVLWINSISTRTPSLTNGRDLRKIMTKLAGLFRGARRVGEQMWVYTPVVLPFHNNRLATGLNRLILRFMLGLLRWRLGMKRFQLWTFVPTAAEYVGTLGEDISVYYCTDEWSLFRFVTNPEQMTATERRLCEKTDIVFATARTLADRKRSYNLETHVAPHGVDHGLFARALAPETAVPADIAALPGPILGFYGTIEDWIDLDLIAFLAERHPEWTIALIGKVFVDTAAFSKYPNVHFMGRRDHSDLPAYCKAFSVGLIPYAATNERMYYVNPVKLREYLSAGVPVVATDAVPEVLSYEEYCAVTHTYEDFERAVEEALRKDSPERRRQRSDAMRGETWERKVWEVASHIVRVADVKTR